MIMPSLTEARTTRAVTRVSVIDPTTDPRWSHFVDRHPQGTVFHRGEWAKVLMDAYDYTPRYHVLCTDHDLLAAWPSMYIDSKLTGRRLVTLPFSDRCAPLLTDDEEGVRLFESIRADVADLGAGRIEVRGWPESLNKPAALQPSHGYVYHAIDLSPGHDAVFKGLAENARRSIKRGAKYGVTTRLAESQRDLDLFFGLNVRLRRQHGMLPQPRRFFQAIFRHLVEPGLGYILLAEREGQVLAALLCLRHKDVTLDKYALNDSRLREYRGSHVVMWRAIEMELERGARWYDMGRSDARAESLHRFKAQWGGREADAPYFYCPKAGGMNTEDPKGKKQTLVNTFSRWAPEPVFLLAGNLAYRHLG